MKSLSKGLLLFISAALTLLINTSCDILFNRQEEESGITISKVSEVSLDHLTYDIEIYGNTMYAVTNSTIYLVNISDPEHPLALYTIYRGGYDVDSFAGFAYVVATTNVLTIYATTSIDDINPLGSYSNADFTIEKILANGRYAYASTTRPV